MRRERIHRIVELAVGVPLAIFGGYLIYGEIEAELWIRDDPEHRRRLFPPLGIILGTPPFLVGCWLIAASAFRALRRNHAP